MFFRMVYKSGQIFYRFVTIHNDRQKDGHTDRRTDKILITIPRLHYMQRGKNTLALQCQRVIMGVVNTAGCNSTTRQKI